MGGIYLSVERITCGYGLSPVLADFSLTVGQGDFLGIVGPNGSGKSTLVRAISRALPPTAGTVQLNRRDIFAMRPSEIAREVAVLGQETAIDYEFTVYEVVLMGRLPHLSPFKGETERDYAAVRRAMAVTDTTPLKDRLVTTLSGGERQRVLVARALAQEPKLLILDEPTAHLDIAHQVELLDLTRRLNQEENLTVIAVLHDLNLASQYAMRLLMMKAGDRFIEGTPQEVVTEENVAAVFGSMVRVIPHPLEGTPHVILLSGERAGTRRHSGVG